MNSINWPASSVWVFIAQLGEHCSANAEATGSNPVEAPKIFFSGYFRNCLNCDSLLWSHAHLFVLCLIVAFVSSALCVLCLIVALVTSALSVLCLIVALVSSALSVLC